MAQRDLFNRSLDAGKDVTNRTQDLIENLVRDVAKTAEDQAAQAQSLVQEIVDRSRTTTEQLVETVDREIRNQLSSVGVATKSDITRLEGKIERLRNRLGERVGLRSSTTSAPRAAKAASSSAKKASSATKSAAKKATAVKKTAAKKATAVKKRAAKKATGAKKSVARTAAVKKSSTTKKAASVKKSAVKKASATKKSAAKKSAAKTSAAKKSAASRPS